MAKASNKYYLAIKTENCGFNKPIFVIKTCLFKIEFNDNKASLTQDILNNIPIIEKKDFLYNPIRPDIDNPHIDEEGFETINYNDFEIDAWDNKWSLEISFLDDYIAKSPPYNNEEELLRAFYKYWYHLTVRYHNNIRLVTKNVLKDVAHIYNRMSIYRKELRPLNFQLTNNRKFIKYNPIDIFSMQHLLEHNADYQKTLDTCPYYVGNHEECVLYITWHFINILLFQNNILGEINNTKNEYINLLSKN